MINISVDLTRINKKLNKLQDVLSVNKTALGKSFVSDFAESAKLVFAENSIERIQKNKPPDVKSLRRRGKRKSMKAYALAKANPLFITEKTIMANSTVIGIGIDMNRAPAHLPIEDKYLSSLGEFSDYMRNRIPYDFAGTSAQNVFLIRHYGLGAKGVLPGYIGKRLYPNNLSIFTTGGRLFTTRFLSELIDSYNNAGEFSEEDDDDLYDDKDSDAGKHSESNPYDAFFEIGGEKLKTDSFDDDMGSGKISIMDHILSQISEETRENFLAANFSSVKTIDGRGIIMWHPGVKPYDWFKDTGYGATLGKPFASDVQEIADKAELFYKEAIRVIVK